MKVWEGEKLKLREMKQINDKQDSQELKGGPRVLCNDQVKKEHTRWLIGWSAIRKHFMKELRGFCQKLMSHMVTKLSGSTWI